MIAFVLGNGQSRAAVPVDQLLALAPVYGCNALYRTHRVTALVATDDKISRAIEQSGYPRHTPFYTRRPTPGTGAHLVPQQYRGFSSGPIALALAAQAGYQDIYLLGFDMAPMASGRFNNVYAGTEFYKPPEADPTYTGNWQRQLRQVMQDHAAQRFWRVFGDTTAVITELDQLTNYHTIAMAEFLAQINKPKDHQ